MHACCAPCSVQCVETLRAEGFEPSAFFYNPNIHPYSEYANRLSALERLRAVLKLNLITSGGYGLREFLTATDAERDFPARCTACYAIRLGETARFAAENGFEYFSTTLLISPYQNHALIAELAEELASRSGVKFLYRDFRKLFRSGQIQARELGLYTQKYCGCIFSEEERYKK